MSIKHVTALLADRTRVYAWQVAGSQRISMRRFYSDGEWSQVETVECPSWWFGAWSPESMVTWQYDTSVLGAPTPVTGLWAAMPGLWQFAPVAVVDYCFPNFYLHGRRDVVVQACTCWEGRHALRTFRDVASAVASLTPGQIGRMTTDPAVNEMSRAAAVAHAARMGWGKAA